MANDKVTIEIGVTGNAKVELKKISEQAEKTSTQMKKGFGDSARAFDVFAGNLAASAVTRTLELAASAASGLFRTFVVDGVKAAQVQEDAINDLNTALRQSGEFSEESSRDIQDFASALQATTKFGDEAILSQTALARAFTSSNDEAKELVTAAVDLSARFGITLESAVRNLGKTYSGLTGELGELIPAIRTLSAEQLKNGEAVKLLGSLYAGSAQAQTNTYSGATEQLSNAFGDLQEAIGSVITENASFIRLIKNSTETIASLTKNVNDSSEVLKQFFSGVIVFGIDILQGFIRAIDSVGKAFLITAAGIEAAVTVIIGGMVELIEVLTFQDSTQFSKNLNDSLKQLGGTIKDIFNDTSATKINEQLESLEDALKGVERQAQSTGDAMVENSNKAKDANREASDALKKRLDDEVKSIQKANDEKLEAKILFLEQALEADSLDTESRKLLEESLTMKRLELRAQEEAVANDLIEKEIQRNEKRNIINRSTDQEVLKSRIDTLRQAENNTKISADKRLEIETRRVQAEIQLERTKAQQIRGVINDFAAHQNSKSKEIATVAKGAAVASATIRTYEAANNAYAAMAGIPFVGPALGIAAAAAAIAAGLQNVSTIVGTPLETGLTSVPPGFQNDTFAARLTTGERVVNAPQNRDLTGFLRDSNGLGKKLDRLIKITESNNTPIVVNIGGQEIVNVLQSELDGGRTVVL